MPPDTLHISGQHPDHQIPEYQIENGDTVYIPGLTGPPPMNVADTISVGHIINLDSFIIAQRGEAKADEDYTTTFTNGGDIFMALLIIAAVIRSAYILYFDKEPVRKRKARSRLQEIKESKQSPYHDWLLKYNPYYQSLSATEQKRFLQRTCEFLSAKEFRFHSMVEEEYIPVLISGAAVQITFGLPNYMMDFFPVIHVIRKEYVLDIDKETYYGHVSKTGIYISWNHFLEGYHDYGDSINIGLHEMAHALSYDAFLGEADSDDIELRSQLKEFSVTALPVLRKMRAGYYTVLDTYATENMDEFWAVSIETFFENPLELKHNLPDLYTRLVKLLNQDPLKPAKIVNYRILGLGNDQR